MSQEPVSDAQLEDIARKALCAIEKDDGNYGHESIRALEQYEDAVKPCVGLAMVRELQDLRRKVGL